MHRRVLAVALVAVLLTGGCLGFITGQEAAGFESAPVSVAEEARSDAGYEEVRVASTTRTQTFSAAGRSRTVNVTNHVAEYGRSAQIPVLSDQQVARFTVLSTPQVEVLDRSFNPVGELSNRELAQRLQGSYESLSDLRLVGNRTVASLGAGRQVSKFRATATTVGGQETEVVLHVANFAHGEDFVVVVAVHPERVDGEQARVDTLIGGIRHG